MRALLLFDLDGTLVQSNGAGTIAIDRTFSELFGITGAAHRVDWRGKPDTRIFREILEACGLEPTPDRLAAARQSYLHHLKQLVGDHPGSLPPGIPAVLEAAAVDPRFRLALGTGNLEEGCRAKLAVHDLNRFFPVGGFAEDGEDRRELIRAAWIRSARYYWHQDSPRAGGEALRFFDRVIVIGDTPLDIDAAAANGFYSLAVATGNHTLAQLVACRPTLAFPDLADVHSVLQAVAALPAHPWADPTRAQPLPAPADPATGLGLSSPTPPATPSAGHTHSQ
ncbi:MAG: HAD hydrolase-like protein [Limnochordaceae bacterium]|nr:HAD hydrolase-like protein [Limnochordaceae bacterium]